MSDVGPARRLEEFAAEVLGTGRVTVEAAGPGDEIAVLRVPAGVLGAVLGPGARTRICQEARRLGYEYAALDLDLVDEAGTGSGDTQED